MNQTLIYKPSVRINLLSPQEDTLATVTEEDRSFVYEWTGSKDATSLEEIVKQYREIAQQRLIKVNTKTWFAFRELTNFARIIVLI